MCNSAEPFEAGIALEVFARLIEILAERGLITASEIMELVEIARRYERQ